MKEESNNKLKKTSAFRKKFVDYYKNYIQYIEERNKKFNALSREKRIVALCQDAIYHILMGTIKPTSGKYLEGIEPKEDLLLQIEPRENTSSSSFSSFGSFSSFASHRHLEKVTCSLISENENKERNVEDFILEEEQFQTTMPLVECEACAKGGLMVAAISFKNKLTIDETIHNEPSKLPKILKNDFTALEWDLIEICFERWGFGMDRFQKNFVNKMKRADKIFTDLVIKAPEVGDAFYKENDEKVYYGIAYAIKHIDTSFYESDENNVLSEEKVESLLLQIYCSIIANRGDIFKALSLDNNKVVDYNKVITEAEALYPAFQTKKELNARIKELTKFIRKKPLSLKELNDTLVKELFD